MTAVLCLANNNGLSFNGRRVSRDIKVSEEIVERAGAAPLLITPAAAPVFSGVNARMGITPDFSGPLPANAVCFFDTAPPADVSRFDAVELYRWGRDYPADVFFAADLPALGFRLTESAVFAGNSHPEITREVYIRET